MSLPRVEVVALGGTIAMTGDTASGVTPTLTADALVAAVPGMASVARVRATTFRQVPGAHLDLADLVALAAEVETLLDGDADGVVVTQGTDTIEESAFALDLLTSRPAPVVVTGAMRNPDQPGTDGPANLLNAVRIAASPAARDAGVLVTMDDVIHTPRFLRKTHASRPSAFESETAGPVGWISEDRVRVPLRPRNRVRLRVAPGTVVPAVPLVRAVLGGRLDVDLVSAAPDVGGLVIEGFGAGHLRPHEVDAVADVAARVPVVLASRTGAGEGYRSTYGFPGSERDLLRRGVLSAGALDGSKARLLLALALAASLDRPALAAVFETLSE